MLPKQLEVSKRKDKLTLNWDQESFEVEAMRRCIELGRRGKRSVAPNPMVGAVISHKGQIIGHGFHERYGSSHAEINALLSVEDQALLSDSTLYVSLEPCAHFGKTPPCTAEILKRGVPRVVVATLDTSRKVNGKGIEELQGKGVQVKVGLLADEARALNRRFFTMHELSRPYVVLKWAQTTDGYIAGDEDSPRWISGEAAREMTHNWRAEEAAIMIGTTTAYIDNPILTARPQFTDELRQPLRVVLDRKLTLNSDLNVFNDASQTLIINGLIEERRNNLRWAKIDFHGDVIKQTLQLLHSQRISSILVEGGAKLLQSFIASNLWDEARVFVSARTLGSGVKAPFLPVSQISSKAVGEDTLNIYNNSSYKLDDSEIILT